MQTFPWRRGFCFFVGSVVVVTGAANGKGQIASDTRAVEKGGSEAKAVLRHAVFFKFKDTASVDDVSEVVRSFAALPSKIDSIKDFCWGTCANPEGRSDGFTHCFLLTFADEAGRAEYLPHPQHKEFGAGLRPHLDKVFVVDYWATPQPSRAAKELKHFVFFQFKDDIRAGEVRALEQELAGLSDKIETVKALEWGTNNSPEKHDAGFTHAFCLTFDSEAGLADYAVHPAHKAFAERALPKAEQVRVIDFWAKRADPVERAD